MKALRIKNKSAYMAASLFFAVVMAGNPIAASFGFSPAKDVVRTFRVRSVRNIRQILRK